MVQIQFLDKSVVNALVPAFSMKPERVVFLYDTRDVGNNMMREVEEAIKARLPKTAVQYVRTNMLRLSDVKDELKKVVAIFKNKEIQIDITGGTEIMTAGGLMVAQENHLTATYVDFFSSYICNVMTSERMAPVEHVKLEDYLRAIGGRFLSCSEYTPPESDYDRLLCTAEVIFANERKWDKFFKHMSTSGYTASGVMEFSMKNNKDDGDCRFLLNLFLQKGFVQKIGEDRYRFASERDKGYFSMSGIWLELYIYIQAKKCYDEVYTSVEIDWNKRDICRGKDNEIDVVIMKNSQPIFVSCKMCKVEKAYIYEVYSMARRLSGNNGKSIIATTTPVRETSENPNSIYFRLGKMKVGLIEHTDFEKRPANEVFANALRMTE